MAEDGEEEEGVVVPQDDSVLVATFRMSRHIHTLMTVTCNFLDMLNIMILKRSHEYNHLTFIVECMSMENLLLTILPTISVNL